MQHEMEYWEQLGRGRLRTAACRGRGESMLFLSCSVLCFQFMFNKEAVSFYGYMDLFIVSSHPPAGGCDKQGPWDCFFGELLCILPGIIQWGFNGLLGLCQETACVYVCVCACVHKSTSHLCQCNKRNYLQLWTLFTDRIFFILFI